MSDGDRLLHVDFRKKYPVAVRGEGMYIYDAAGRRYLDAAGGAYVVTIGHSVPDVVRAIAEQAARLTFSYRLQFSNEPAEALAKVVIDLAPGGFSRVFFTSGGSEASETAFKLARQYHVERGEAKRAKIVARWQSYHGNTLGALSASGHVGRRRVYDPMLLPFPHIPAVNCYRCPWGLEHPACGVACADELERLVLNEGPETIAAFVAEPIVGAAAGAPVPPADYFPRIRQICDRYGILFISDEVITGFGRTGTPFGLDQWNVMPDLIVCAKGLASGYAPLGAVIVHGRVVDALARGSAAFGHGFTFGGNPLSCAAGLAVQRYAAQHRLYERVGPMGAALRQQLDALATRHPIIGDVRGLGLLFGLELVSDRAEKRPFDPRRQIAQRLTDLAFEHGVIIYPGQGTAAGLAGDHVMLAPPYVIEAGHVKEIVDALDTVLATVEAEVL